MALYEKRTYGIRMGQMAEIIRVYSEEAWPVMEREGFGKHLVGYFVSDTGRLHQLVHLWRFDTDAERRDFWKRLFASEAFLKAAVKLRPLIETQEVQLLTPAPWGPKP